MFIARATKHRILEVLDSDKAVMLLGARQVGKTTLLREIIEQYDGSLFLDCDEPDVRAALSNTTSTQMKALFGKAKLVVIDEAQRVKNIGLTLKLITDNIKNVKLIASGSSALELSSEINEPLTGRKVEIIMSGVTLGELIDYHGAHEEKRMMEQRLTYGMYPEIITNEERAEVQLTELSNGYVYKDIFNYQDIRKPELLPNLLEALARQVGSEVSYNELARLLSSDPVTISRYIDLLEKTMVVFRLRSFNRNLRNELKKSRKIYFYDNGIRNAVIGDFRPVKLRTDAGALWENFIISERIKYLNNIGKPYTKRYFWRTTQQQEIDYIEDYNGRLDAYELKYNPKAKAKFSKTFTNEYDVSSTHVINSENYLEFY